VERLLSVLQTKGVIRHDGPDRGALDNNGKKGMIIIESKWKKPAPPRLIG
jgi:hypothetical protein